MTKYQHRYIPLLRPPGFATLPGGVKWDYVEVPLGTNRPDLPVSRHTHGVIATDRPLTPDEATRYDMRAVTP